MTNCPISVGYRIEKAYSYIKTIGESSYLSIQCHMSSSSVNFQKITIKSREIIIVVRYVGNTVATDIEPHCQNISAFWRKRRNISIIVTGI